MDAGHLPDQIRTMVDGYRASGDAERLRHLLLDTIGVAMAGAAEDAPLAMRSVAAHSPLETASTVIGGRASDPISASAANAVAVHVLDYDDTHNKSLVHVSSTVLPVVLALAEQVDAPVEAVLEAYGLGVRLSAFFEELGPLLNGAGVHATAVIGSIAAAGAGAWLLTADPAASARAGQLAAGTAIGLAENFGSQGKSLQVGVAAANAARAALLSRAGATAGDSLFGGRGIFHATLDVDARQHVRWTDPCDDAVALLASKPYACCYLLHPAINAALEARSRMQSRPEVLADDVELVIGSLAGSLANLPARPGDSLSAKFSAAFCVAQSLSTGRLTVSDLRNPLHGDSSAAGRILERLTVAVDPALSPAASTLTVRLDDGGVVSSTVTGDDGPVVMSANQLEVKFTDNAAAVLESAGALALQERLLTLPGTASSRGLLNGIREQC